MNKTAKKVLSLVLMMIMILSSIPMTSLAANTMCSIIGHATDWVVTKEATCTEAGEKVKKCTRSGCDYTTSEKEVIPYKSHTIEVIPASSPTCDKPGNTEGSYCTTCDLIVQPCETIAALGHTPVDFNAVDATCGVNGITAGKKCAVCDKIISGGDVIAAPGHDFKTVSFTAGSCEDNTPTIETKRCKNCGKEETTEKKAECEYSAWTTQTIATCSATGKMTRTCKECGSTEEKIIDKLPHTEVVVIAEAATCEKAGKSAGKKCTVCNAITQGCETIPALGHKEKTVAGYAAECGKKGLTDGAYCEVCNKETKAQVEIAALEHIMETDKSASSDPTCTTDGLKVEKCVRVGCGYTKSEVVAKTHGDGLKVTKQPTCTEEGKKSGYCTTCKQTVVETIPALGHLVTNALSWYVVESATCTKEGKKVAKCARSGCNGQATEVIPALEHQEVVYTPAKEPTCKEEGATESKQCTICKNITVKSEKIAKLEHSYGEWTETKTATCLVPGVKESVCTVCNEKQLQTLERLPHTEEKTEAKAATCTEAGVTEGITCTVCKTVIQKATPVDALGHDYIKDEANCAEPSCVLEGRFCGTCSRCGDVKDEILPANGHDEEVTPGTPADCTLSGVSDGKKCKVCGEITAEPQQIEPLGHDFVVDANTSKPATCTENGFENLNCSRCKAVDQRETVATGHSYGDWEVTLQPTCDKQGEQTRVCVVCQAKDVQPIESNGSHNVVIQEAVAATCTTDGMTQGSYCDKCNEIFEVQEVIPAYGHNVDGVEPTLTPATFTKDGSYAIACEDCNELVNPQVIAKIDEKSIKLSTAKCTYNGKKRTPSVTVKDVNGKVLEKDTDYTVKYDSGRKAVGEYKITVTFKGNYEGKKTLIFTIAPGKTSKVTATSSQKDYVKISWAAVEGATGYRVYVYETVEGKTRKKVASVTGTSYNLKKDYLGDTMAVGAQYKVAVVAYAKLGDDTVIHALSGVAKTFTRTPGKPSLTVTSASGKANLKWTNVDDETGYQVYYATSKDGEYKKAVSTAKNTYSKAFTKGKTIYFKVRAYAKIDGEVIYGSFSDVKSITIK